MEQSIEEGTTAAIIINVIGEDGNHVAATINTATTRLSTHASAVPVVTQRDVGVYLIKWTGLSPALSPSDNDNGVSVEVNGTISGTAWTSYHIPIAIVATGLDEAGVRAAVGLASANLDTQLSEIPPIKSKTDQLAFTVANQVDANTLTGGIDGAGVRSAVGLAGANLDTQLADIPTVSEFEARTITASDYFDPNADTVVNVTTVGTVTNSVTTSNASDVTAIKAKTDQFVFSVSNQVDANTLTGGIDEAGVRSAVGLAGANLDTQLADIPTVSEFESRTIVSSAYFDPSADSVITANASDVTAIKAVTDSLPDSGSLTSLATSSALSVVDTNVDSIKAKTDQFVFTVSNQVDANSITGGISASEVEDAVWDAAYSSHKSAGTFGKLMDQLKKANRAIDGEVAGTPTVTAFDTNLTGYASGAFDSELLVFVSGSLNGEARPILSYDSSAGRVTFEEVWTAAPSSSDEFVILPYHVHPVSEIAAGVLAGGDVDGFSLEETLKLCLSALAGKISGAGSGTVTIRSADDSKNRIIATTDSKGNRLSITIDKDG